MADLTNSLEVEETDVLHSSLSTAFSPTSVNRQSTARPSQSSPAESSALDSPLSKEEAIGSLSSSSDDWKSEYESQVQTWRAQSAEAREKAEKERDRWEGIRKAERQDAELRKAEGRDMHLGGHEAGWETVSQKQTTHTAMSGSMPSPSPAGAMDFDTGSTTQNIGKNGLPTVPKSSEPSTSKHERQDTSEKWEDVPSLTSSFPSMSFPERSSGTSPEPAPRSSKNAQGASAIPAKAPISATLAIFDSSLPTGARISALFASLAINMLLPFVNGVMLGFGEIFAKNVVLGWFGWKSGGGGSVATNVGVGVRHPPEQRRRGPYQRTDHI